MAAEQKPVQPIAVIIVLLLILFSMLQVWQMLQAETAVVVDDGDGLKLYYQGFGMAMLASAVAYMILGYDEDIKTVPPKK